MVFTTPRDWSTAEFVTEAMMDTHIRDNFLAMGPHLIARKTSDQSVTSSTVLVDDTALTLTVAANEIWQFEFFVRYEADASGHMDMSFSFPTSGRVDAQCVALNSGNTLAQGIWALTASDGTEIGFKGDGAAAIRTFPITGTYIGAGTAGTLKLRWAQATSSATATIVKAQSTLWAVKLA